MPIWVLVGPQSLQASGRTTLPLDPGHFQFVIPIESYRAKLYRVSQKERSIFWEVIVSVILSKKYVCTCVLFRTVSEIELFHCTVSMLLIRKRYYLLFLIPVFIVHVTKLVQFTCTVYSVLYSEIAVSRKPFGIGHMYIYIFLLRMTDTMST
jgi:hypothetical protein